MKDKLMELTKECRVMYPHGDRVSRYADGYKDAMADIADRLDAIIDAEGDGGVPLPGVVWNERTEAAHLIKRGTEVEFCAEYGCCRVFTHPARSGAVSVTPLLVGTLCKAAFGHDNYGYEAQDRMRAALAAQGQSAASPAGVPDVELAYAMGWRRAALWANRDDLICDIDSPAFERDRAIDLAAPSATPEGGEVEVLARRLCAEWNDTQGAHCNRFPGWSELSEKERNEWRAKARAQQPTQRAEGE